MIRISHEKAMALHTKMTDATGGDNGIRDHALLDSALSSAYQTFGGVELYPTVEEKAARMGFSLIANHAFVDGNKRIGVFIMLIFLEINGAPITPTVDEVIRIGLGVASGEISYQELLHWIRANRK